MFCHWNLLRSGTALSTILDRVKLRLAFIIPNGSQMETYQDLLPISKNVRKDQIHTENFFLCIIFPKVTHIRNCDFSKKNTRKF